MILGTTDLLACPIISYIIAAGLWRPKDPDCDPEYELSKNISCQYEYYVFQKEDDNIFNLSYTVVIDMLMISPIVTTSILATTRYFQIKYPLAVISRALVVTCLVVLMLAIFVFWITDIVKYYVTGEGEPSHMVLYDRTYIVDTIYYYSELPMMLVSAPGLVFTILTAIHLFRRYFNPVGGVQHSATGATRVLIMNCISLVNVLFFMAGGILANTDGYDEKSLTQTVFYFSTWGVIPVLTSLADPIVYTAFSKNVLSVQRS